MIISTAEQGSPEWFQSRLGRATGSHFSDVLAKGKSGEATTRANYRVKLAIELATGELCDEDNFTSKAMNDGVEREPIAKGLYSFANGEDVEEVGFCMHDTIMCGVSPDGLVGSNGLIEIKCPTKRVHYDYILRGNEPPEYRAQIMGQLWVMEREWCDFVSFNPAFPENARLNIKRVYRDEAYISTLKSEIEKFMEEVQQTADHILKLK
jgi:hypothetical protein